MGMSRMFERCSRDAREILAPDARDDGGRIRASTGERHLAL